MFCKNCGTQNADGTKFCTNCGQPLEEAPAQNNQTTVIVQQQAKPKRNIGALVCAIIGAVFGMLAGVIWMSCFLSAGSLVSQAGFDGSKGTLYGVVLGLLGIGGGVFTLIGGVQAFRYQKRTVAIALSFVGAAFQLGALIATIIIFGSAFIATIAISIETIISLILCIVAACLSLKKNPDVQA